MPTEVTEVAYTTAATAKGGRAGRVTSVDGVVDFELAQPGNFSKPTANPETLFAAGYAACFSGALNLVSKNDGVDASESLVTATVSFGKTGDTGFGLAVEITAEMPGVDPAKAAELVEKAHQVCPYSRATRDNIVVTARVK